MNHTLLLISSWKLFMTIALTMLPPVLMQAAWSPNPSAQTPSRWDVRRAGAVGRHF
jgi:hypothetical protein